MVAQLIPISSPSQDSPGQSNDHFIAVISPSISLQALQTFTPRIMQWSEDTYLLDLRPCWTYWVQQASRKNQSLLAFFRQILQRLGQDPDTHTLDVYAATHHHPWSALLLAQHMKLNRLPGLLSVDGSVGQNLYRDLSWTLWMDCVLQAGKYFQAAGRKGFHENTLRKQCTQMTTAVNRIGLEKPWDLEAMDSLAIRRRFGSILEEVWAWTYNLHDLTKEIPATSSNKISEGFPWISVQFTEMPSVSRYLEHPVIEWDHVQPFLKEDLDRLCDLKNWDNCEKVLSLEWQLVFPDTTSLSVCVLFRHPHHLHSEKGCHKTALLQARYSFEAAITGSQLDPCRLDEHLPTMPITSWNLQIRERLRMPHKARDLFGSFDSGSSNLHAYDHLIQLENKLSVPLHTYHLSSNWIPEDSFHEKSQTCQSAYVHPDEQQSSLAALGRSRPLFFHQKPQPFQSHGKSLIWKFCERTMDKWWHHPTGTAVHQRDYYVVNDSEGRTLWVFKNNLGQSFVQGIF